jgi:hypothetical protein
MSFLRARFVTATVVTIEEDMIELKVASDNRQGVFFLSSLPLLLTPCYFVTYSTYTTVLLTVQYILYTHYIHIWMGCCNIFYSLFSNIFSLPPPVAPSDRLTNIILFSLSLQIYIYIHTHTHMWSYMFLNIHLTYRTDREFDSGGIFQGGPTYSLQLDLVSGCRLDF